jgi:RHS repeat-associated protein
VPQVPQFAAKYRDVPGSPTESAASKGDRFKFTGQQLDTETGLYQAGARYYDPATGRFIGEDPIGFDGGDGNLYRYVGNNTTNELDPSGLATPASMSYPPVSSDSTSNNWWLYDWLFGVPAETAVTAVNAGTTITQNLQTSNAQRRTYDLSAMQGSMSVGGNQAYWPQNPTLTPSTAQGLQTVATATAGSYGAAFGAVRPTPGPRLSCGPGAAAARRGGLAKSGKLNAPNATDPALQDAYKNLWRPQDKNPGGTIGELLREVETGGPLVHLEKAKGRLRQLIDRVSDTSRPLTSSDRAGAERLINDLKDAIRSAGGR